MRDEPKERLGMRLTPPHTLPPFTNLKSIKAMTIKLGGSDVCSKLWPLKSKKCSNREF